MAILLGSLSKIPGWVEIPAHVVIEACQAAGYRRQVLSGRNAELYQEHRRAWNREVLEDGIPTEVMSLTKFWATTVIPVLKTYWAQVNYSLEGETLKVTYTFPWFRYIVRLAYGNSFLYSSEKAVEEFINKALQPAGKDIRGVEAIGVDPYCQDWGQAGCVIEHIYFLKKEIPHIPWSEIFGSSMERVYPEWMARVSELLASERK